MEVRKRERGGKEGRVGWEEEGKGELVLEVGVGWEGA